MGALKSKSTGILTFSDYHKKRNVVAYAVMIFLLSLVVAVVVLPLIWLFLSGFKSTAELFSNNSGLLPEAVRLAKLGEVWKQARIGGSYLSSLAVIGGAVVCAVFFNGLLAYVVSILKPKFHKAVFALIMAGLMVPATTSLVPLFKNIVALGLVNSYIPLWLAFGANAFYFVMIKTYFDGLPPSLVESAKIDGANKFVIFYKIVLPLSMPIVGVVAIFTVNAAWSDFLLPYLILQSQSKQTVMVKIFELSRGLIPEFGEDKLLVTIFFSIIPPVIIFLLFQKQITGNVATEGMKD